MVAGLVQRPAGRSSVAVGFKGNLRVNHLRRSLSRLGDVLRRAAARTEVRPQRKIHGTEAGIWLSDTGPAVDAEGNLYVSTGNGTLTPQTPAATTATPSSNSTALLAIRDFTAHDRVKGFLGEYLEGIRVSFLNRNQAI